MCDIRESKVEGKEEILIERPHAAHKYTVQTVDAKM